ncbi:MAG: hypothetical protein FJZ90_12810, partial [Chloroflexi bacterium]|nr:hypothetical protein [Chloroflexota bacterium]
MATYTLPDYLPSRLAICYWGWDWITSALPDEPFGDLDRALTESAERGFNCVRAEMGLNWMYDHQGQPRGPMEFTDWIPGASENLQCVNGKGGGRHDILQRVLSLFELAQKHGMYVIMTSWEYQDSNTQVADPAIREQAFSVPVEARLLHLARQYDRLLTALAQRGLGRQIAFVEVHNEIDSSEVPREEAGQVAAAEAIAYLRARHPALLVTADYGRLVPHLVPDNAQVVDHHIYVQSPMSAVLERAGCRMPGFPDFANNAFLRWITKPDPMPWAEFGKRAERVRSSWWPIGYLYHNLDIEKYDWWCLRHYGEYVEWIAHELRSRMKLAGDLGAKRGLPVVVDEGYNFYPPLHSEFIQTAAGRWVFGTAVEEAIASGHWGIMPTGY